MINQSKSPPGVRRPLQYKYPPSVIGVQSYPKTPLLNGPFLSTGYFAISLHLNSIRGILSSSGERGGFFLLISLQPVIWFREER